jgi:hypothetical protein
MASLGDKTVLKLNEAAELYSAASTANTAFYVDAVGGDYKMLLTFANASGASGNVTIAVGDGPLGAGKDLTFAVANNKTKGITIDSGYFKIFKGDHKDKIKITTTAAMTVTVVELPQ